MTTASTKSRGSKKLEASKNAPVSLDQELAEPSSSELSPLAWRIASLSVLAVAALIRLYKLGLKPMHHDEGVNGFFLTNLYRNGVYHYDPANYHGPTLYYFALVIAKINAFLFGQAAGLNTIAVRLVPVIFGIGTIWLILCLRRHLGAMGALAAAALVALSPGHVYISRYFIHEAHFVFFTLGIVVAALNYYDRRRPTTLAMSALILILFVVFLPTIDSIMAQLFPALGVSIRLVFSLVLSAAIVLYIFYVMYTQDEAIPVYLLLAFASAAFLFATKETAFISVAVLGLSTAIAAGYIHLFRRNQIASWEKPLVSRKKMKKQQPARIGVWLNQFGGLANIAIWMGIGLALFIFLNIVFYSSFFTYREGIGGAIESLQVWAKTGNKDHAHEWYTYIIWLWEEEAPLLCLGVAGAVTALITRRSRFAIFAGAWAFGLLAAYSLIPYKTPWLMLSFLVPLAIAGGYAINELYSYADDFRLRLAAVCITVVALLVLGTQSIKLNFFYYDDDHYPYVYAHTRRELHAMVNKIEELAARAQTGKETGITITAPEYWPMPWYLRNYEHAGFFGRMAPTDQPIVVGSIEQIPELDAMLGDRYSVIGTYPLRPGVTLVLYAKKELIDSGSPAPLNRQTEAGH